MYLCADTDTFQKYLIPIQYPILKVCLYSNLKNISLAKGVTNAKSHWYSAGALMNKDPKAPYIHAKKIKTKIWPRYQAYLILKSACSLVSFETLFKTTCTQS